MFTVPCEVMLYRNCVSTCLYAGDVTGSSDSCPCMRNVTTSVEPVVAIAKYASAGKETVYSVCDTLAAVCIHLHNQHANYLA